MNHIMRRGLPMALLVVTVAFAWPAVSFAVQATLTDDSYTVSAGTQVNTGHGTKSTILVSPTTTGFLQFDLSTLPAGTTSANIEIATLTLFVTRDKVPTPGSFDVKLVTAA